MARKKLEKTKVVSREESARATDGPHRTRVVVSGELPVLVEPGIYDLKFDRRWLGKVHGTAFKLALWFQILDPGPYSGFKVARFYNVKRANPQGGHFQVGPHSAFVREYCALFQTRVSTLRDVPISPFSEVIVRGRIKTVSSDRQQRPLTEANCYSVVEELLEICAGACASESRV